MRAARDALYARHLRDMARRGAEPALVVALELAPRDRATDAVDAAHELARRYHCVVAVSGPVDMITDGDELVKLSNGSAMLTQVTGVGCALGAVLINRVKIGDFTTATPKDKYIASANWTLDKYSAILRLTRFGKVKQTATSAAHDAYVSPALIVEVGQLGHR